MEYRIKIWDVPTRLFHWSLVGLFAVMWYTGEGGGDLREDTRDDDDGYYPEYNHPSYFEDDGYDPINLGCPQHYDNWNDD